MSELSRDLEQLIDQLQSKDSGSATGVLLEAMDPVSAARLRLCAIPHSFDLEILMALAPGISAQDAAHQCLQFEELSCVTTDNGELTLHGVTRSELFSEWLEPRHKEEFAAASSRLVTHFDRLSEACSEAMREPVLTRRMFHLLGADQATGFAEFETLCRTARHQSRLSVCAHLISRVHEYDAVLAPESAVSLTYHEGKLASDLRAWEVAERMFENVLANGVAGRDLVAKAHLRLGFVFFERRDFGKAIDRYQRALQITESSDGVRMKPYEILTSLSEAYRERGDLDQAEELLSISLEGAGRVGDQSALANIFNNLGKLHFQRRETEEAASYYEKSLNALMRAGDRFRSAQVLNNLGMVFAETGHWDRAEEFYRESLAIKRDAGDTLGQATTMIHQVRVLRKRGELTQAIELCSRAIALFAGVRAFHSQGQATHTLARMYASTGDLKAAGRALLEAVALLRRSGSHKWAEEALREHGDLARKPGTPWWVWAAAALLVVVILGFLLIVLAL